MNGRRGVFRAVTRQSCYYVNSVVSSVYHFFRTIISPATVKFCYKGDLFPFCKTTGYLRITVDLFAGSLPTVILSSLFFRGNFFL